MKSNTIKASGIKPLNAPRIIYVRTDSDGKPTAVQVSPTITSPRSRRTRHQSNNPHPNPLPTRERGQNTALVSDGAWVKVDEIENLWKVNDEWWRGPDEEIARLYYVLRLANSQQLTVYLDLITTSWYRQTG